MVTAATGPDVGAWLLAACSGVVVAVGVFLIAFRPPLLPEDRRYIAAPQAPLDAVLPGVGRWLGQVFDVMGGYMVAAGVLTTHLALSGYAMVRPRRGLSPQSPASLRSA